MSIAAVDVPQAASSWRIVVFRVVASLGILMYLRVAALALPGADGSFGALGGLLSLAGGTAVLALVWRESRTAP